MCGRLLPRSKARRVVRRHLHERAAELDFFALRHHGFFSVLNAAAPVILRRMPAGTHHPIGGAFGRWAGYQRGDMWASEIFSTWPRCWPTVSSSKFQQNTKVNFPRLSTSRLSGRHPASRAVTSVAARDREERSDGRSRGSRIGRGRRGRVVESGLAAWDISSELMLSVTVDGVKFSTPGDRPGRGTLVPVDSRAEHQHGVLASRAGGRAWRRAAVGDVRSARTWVQATCRRRSTRRPTWPRMPAGILDARRDRICGHRGQQFWLGAWHCN